MRFIGSYSVLDTWQKGNWQRAIEMYFGLVDFKTLAMVDGIKHHEKWKKEVDETKKLPTEFGARSIKGEYFTELYLGADLTNWLRINGYVDLFLADEKTIIDFKTGSGTANNYINSMQAPVYQVLAKANGLESNRAIYLHWNQHIKRATSAHTHLTDSTLKTGVDWLITFASEMQAYLVENNLYEILMPRCTRKTLLREWAERNQ